MLKLSIQFLKSPAQCLFICDKGSLSELLLVWFDFTKLIQTLQCMCSCMCSFMHAAFVCILTQSNHGLTWVFSMNNSALAYFKREDYLFVYLSSYNIGILFPVYNLSLCSNLVSIHSAITWYFRKGCEWL